MPVLQPQLPHHLPQRLDREVGRAEGQGRLSSQHLDFRQQGDVSQFIQIIKEAKRVTYSVGTGTFFPDANRTKNKTDPDPKKTIRLFKIGIRILGYTRFESLGMDPVTMRPGLGRLRPKN